MSKGIDKFNMFENIEDNDEQSYSYESTESSESDESDDVEIVSITMKSDTKKRYTGSVITRSQEDYETYIDYVYYETVYHPTTNEPYQVKVTVLKPEINPLEMMRPVYAYSTNH